jgi:hypothetical protein
MLPGAGGCKEINGPVTSRICPKVADLRTELARAQRRDALLIEMLDAEAAQNAIPAVSYADPGAAALAAYSEALGVPVPAEKLSLWLPLVAVLALQLGAATSVLLSQSVAQRDTIRSADTADSASQGVPSSAPAVESKSARRRGKDRDPPSAGTANQRGKRGIERMLESYAVNGSWTSQREMAKALGMSKSSLNRELHRRRAAEQIVFKTSPAGTVFA